MTPDDLLACAPRIAPSGLARVRLRKDNALGTLVPPGRDGQHLVIALDGKPCLLYTSPSPRDQRGSRMPSSA